MLSTGQAPMEATERQTTEIAERNSFPIVIPENYVFLWRKTIKKPLARRPRGEVS